MKRTLTTNSAAILIPFTTQEVFEPHGLFYDSNARSGNPILADRRSHMNSNGFVLGTSGGGKSFTVKQEIAGMFLNRDDEVIVIDPEREYLALAAAFGGQIIQISAGTGTRVNPMDIVLDDDAASDPVKDKTNNVVSMVGALIGGIDGSIRSRRDSSTSASATCTRATATRAAASPSPHCRTCTTSSRTAATTRAGTSPTRSTRTSPAP